MSSSHGDDFQEFPPAADQDQPEVEPEAGPRAERPNFLTATRFVDFDLPPEIMEGLDKAGFEYCTPIQAQAIPVAMNGLDIAGQAQTGTGKTTAFLVPLLNRLLTGKPLEPGVPRAIIVTPTRELALQIHEDAQVLASATSLRQVLVIGGMDYKEQADILATAPEIVICTPGRIIDYLQQGVFKTKGVEVAVVDEADRLLDMGFIKDLKYLLGKLPPFSQRQTMLFSATLDDRVLELTYEFMNPPQYITAEPDKSTKVNIAQELYHVGRDEKLQLLLGLLRREEHRRVIIFANTKSGVEWLSKKLTMNGFQAEGITGDLPQPKRLKLMEAFKENRLQILVATDVASRGIHVDDVSHVYNYDLPQDAENYVHRIGRTARAGHEGKAVSFGCEDYVFHLEAIENLLGEKIPVFWAEQDWFQTDQGGEVRLKYRRGGDRNDRKKSGPRGGGRGEGRSESGSGGGRAYRGPAKSQRPGGIFGLSPRFQGQPGDEDPRQGLTWALESTEALAEDEILDAVLIEAPEGQEKEGKSDRDRRRKRRRGRRGRDGVEAASPIPSESLAGDETKPEALPPEQVIKGETVSSEPSPVVEELPAPTRLKAEKEELAEPAKPKGPDDTDAEAPAKAAAQRPRRTGGRRPRKDPAVETLVVEEAALKPAEAQAPELETEAKKSVKKTTKTAAKAGTTSRAKKTEAKDESEAPKPRRSTKKAAETKAPEADSVVISPEAETVKKPRRATKKAVESPEAEGKETTATRAKKTGGRTSRKKDEPASPTEAVAATEEAPKKRTSRAASAKKTDDSPAPAKKKTAKKADESAEAPAKKSRTTKKTVTETE